MNTFDQLQMLYKSTQIQKDPYNRNQIGFYTFSQFQFSNFRCPSYPNLPSGCTRTTDPNDVCCQIPFCPSQAPNPVTYSPQFPYTGAPTLAPSPYTGVPTLTPSPTPYTGQPTPKPTPYTGVPTLAPFATTPKYQVPTLPQGVIVGGSPSPNPQLGFTNAPSSEYNIFL